MIEIKEIGKITAAKIYEWFRDEDNLEFLNKLKKAGIRLTDSVRSPISNETGLIKQSLSGKKFVLTGTLTISRAEIQEKIRARGGRISENINQQIDFIVVGAQPGQKREQARRWGIKELIEKELMEMLNND